MNLIPQAISRGVARQGLMAQKNSPTLLFGAGVAGMITSTVLACRATLKVDEILQETQQELEKVNGAKLMHRAYAEEHHRRDVTVIYTRSIVKIGRLYTPSVAVGVISVACLTKSHQILEERNLALAAAYAAVDKAFIEYRSRVVDKYGEDQDREFRYAIEEVELVDERGKVETVRRVNTDVAPSMYARFFDEYSGVWSKDPEYNLVFLQCQQKYANDMLRARGHLFLNEVYDTLGLSRTKAGSVVGWIMSLNGDNHVDFGIFDNNQNARDFVNGREGAILLDFNVDGVIFDKINPHDMKEIAWQR